MTESVF